MQVSGPTAAFVVILAPVSQRFGVGGLLLAPLMAGAILFAMGIMRLGRFIEFVPYPVTTGFTAGIAEVIATLPRTCPSTSSSESRRWRSRCPPFTGPTSSSVR